MAKKKIKTSNVRSIRLPRVYEGLFQEEEQKSCEEKKEKAEEYLF
jgi:hypothetical protein